ncbi:MAG: translation initiation factor IF-1 [Methylacidiphilales bacterium]|nr:translation initiation factor IF-1 [Candidatus Methylacidiphilales bacterium]
MPSRDSIEVQGTVIDVLKRDAYRVELANGHRCIARASGQARLDSVKFAPSDRVLLEFHPYDLSRARIIG